MLPERLAGKLPTQMESQEITQSSKNYLQKIIPKRFLKKMHKPYAKWGLALPERSRSAPGALREHLAGELPTQMESQKINQNFQDFLQKPVPKRFLKKGGKPCAKWGLALPEA